MKPRLWIYLSVLLLAWLIVFVLPVITVQDQSFLAFPQRMRIMMFSWWFVLPMNFYGNIGLFSIINIQSVFSSLCIIVIYWLLIVGAHVVAIKMKRWWTLLILLGILFVSAIGNGLTGILD